MWRLVLLAALAVVGACSRTPEEQRIRETMATMQRALEAHEPKAFMAHISDDFIGNDAGFGRDELNNFLRVEVLRNDQLTIILGPIEVEIDGDRAKTHVVATLTGGSGGLLPERGSVYVIDSSWKRSGHDWRCYSAHWTQEL